MADTQVDVTITSEEISAVVDNTEIVATIEGQGPKGDTGATGADSVVPGPQGIQGDPGNPGIDGDSSYTYIAYASDDSGTDFTLTFNASLNYIAILTTSTEIISPVVTDFDGLWKNYKGATGETGSQGVQGDPGVDGDDAYVYIAYASDDTGTGFTNTFDANLNYIAIKTTTTAIASPIASDFTGLWKNYKGATGAQGIQGEQGIQGVPGTGEIPGGVANNIVTINASEQIQDSGVAITAFEPAKGADDNFVTDAEKTKLANLSGTNTGDQTLPVKATGAEVDTGTDDAKFVTAKAMEDSSYIKSTGNAATATALATARAINGVNFDGSAAITIPDLILTAAPGSDHLATGIKIALTATATMNFGDVGYIASTGKVSFIDADAIATMSGLVMCVDATINADASGNFLLIGVARDDTWNWTVGGLIYGTVTATTGNTLSQTAPTGTDDVIQILGVATHADRMVFNPQLVQVEHT